LTPILRRKNKKTFVGSKKRHIFAVRLIFNLKKAIMYAIVEIAGQQFKVQKDQKVYVHRLAADAGSKVEFDKVLLVDNDGKINVGAPAIEGAKVTAEVIDHVKGDKVIVFKKKRRKGFKSKNGHRQQFTAINITDIKVK
jgi:large subunit ribosomal protein L21